MINDGELNFIDRNMMSICPYVFSLDDLTDVQGIVFITEEGCIEYPDYWEFAGCYDDDGTVTYCFMILLDKQFISEDDILQAQSREMSVEDYMFDSGYILV